MGRAKKNPWAASASKARTIATCVGRLDALDDGGHAQRVGHVDDRLDHQAVDPLVGLEAGDERAVDLHGVDGQCGAAARTTTSWSPRRPPPAARPSPRDAWRSAEAAGSATASSVTSRVSWSAPSPDALERRSTTARDLAADGAGSIVQLTASWMLGDHWRALLARLGTAPTRRGRRCRRWPRRQGMQARWARSAPSGGVLPPDQRLHPEEAPDRPGRPPAGTPGTGAPSRR